MTPMLRARAVPVRALLLATLSAAPLGGTLWAQAAPPPAERRSDAPRRPTCVDGLKEYATAADVRAPFDTLRLSFPSVAVSPDNMRAFMLEKFAAAGATGFIAGAPQQSGASTFFAFVPLFVPSDTARINAACSKPHSG